MEEPPDGCCDPCFRPGTFQQDAITEVDLIQAIALRLKELPPLVDGGLHNGIVVGSKWNLRSILLEEILIDVEAGTECFECRFQPLDRILLFALILTFIIHAGDMQDHAEISALGEKRGLVPEAVEADVTVQRRRLLPRLDDSIETQHQNTSTRGTSCLAAS